MNSGRQETRGPLGKSRLVGGLILACVVASGCSPRTGPREPPSPVVTVSENSATPALLGYALTVPGVEARIAVDEGFLRGDLTPFESAEGGTLRLVGQPLEWRPMGAPPYLVLGLELAEIARAPTLYLVLLERRDASFVERGVERLGENLFLVSVTPTADTLEVRALDARLGRLPAKRGLGGYFYLFKLTDGSLQRLR